MELSRSDRRDQTSADIIAALEYAQQSGLITGSVTGPLTHTNTPAFNFHTRVEGHERGAEISWQNAYDDRKEQWKRWASAADPTNTTHDAESERNTTSGGISDGSAFREPLSANQPLIRDADMLLDREPATATTAPVDLDVESFAAHHNLNKEQARAFSIVAEHSKNRDNKPLRMYLGGKGGTGKSRVITAMQDYFIQRGEERRFRLSSYTGVAARNISGMTLHAALMFSQHQSSARSAKSKRDLMAI
jgi:hypothetical protein